MNKHTNTQFCEHFIHFSKATLLKKTLNVCSSYLLKICLVLNGYNKN